MPKRGRLRTLRILALGLSSPGFSARFLFPLLVAQAMLAKTGVHHYTGSQWSGRERASERPRARRRRGDRSARGGSWPHERGFFCSGSRFSPVSRFCVIFLQTTSTLELLAVSRFASFLLGDQRSAFARVAGTISHSAVAIFLLLFLLVFSTFQESTSACRACLSRIRVIVILCAICPLSKLY